MNELKALKELVGEEDFNKFFKIILSDNGPEFDSLHELEEGAKDCHVFYTRPYQSSDKGSCERNHEFFRYFYSKGKSLEGANQDEINTIFSNINSYPRKSLNNQAPIDLMIKKMGIKFVTKLGIRKIPFKDIVLKRKAK